MKQKMAETLGTRTTGALRNPNYQSALKNSLAPSPHWLLSLLLPSPLSACLLLPPAAAGPNLQVFVDGCGRHFAVVGGLDCQFGPDEIAGGEHPRGIGHLHVLLHVHQAGGGERNWS
eukprot:GHVT01094550.1.p4 GENE.GHVT01094550.1~~GHVT01094550.1.p4  ORF type:complete len:117 (+),score=27.50 GHVT01094550.1:1605-1955(+)